MASNRDPRKSYRTRRQNRTSSSDRAKRSAKSLAEAAKAGLTKAASNNRKKKAAASIGKYNTKDADGTVRNRKKVGPKKVGPKKVGTVAQRFDAAFAKARKAGKKTFTFQGKVYNTKIK